MIADREDVRAVAARVLAAYGLDPAVVTALALDLNPYGAQEFVVRLAITDTALAALTTPPP